jgi:hypothetical protein
LATGRAEQAEQHHLRDVLVGVPEVGEQHQTRAIAWNRNGIQRLNRGRVRYGGFRILAFDMAEWNERVTAPGVLPERLRC